MSDITIHLCEEQPIVVAGFQHVVREHPEFRLVGHTAELGQLLAAAAETKASIVLISQPVPLRPILPLLSQLRSVAPETRIVLWVAELSEMDSFRALQLGARGILRKTLPLASLVECLKSVAAGNVWLASSLASDPAPQNRNGIHRITPREREIVEYICQGMKNREIAAALSITPGTVKVHLMHIFEKTGVKDRFQLALQARQILGLEPATTEPSGRS